MEKPTIDPPIPYIGSIWEGQFGPGKRVRIQGTAPSVAYRFDVNLQCGLQTAPRADIAIQVSVHLLDGYISMNSLQNGIWGEEQRGRSLPIKRAQSFEIILACGFNQYEVIINGEHYCTFPQRIHSDLISHLAIEGDVSIVQINYEAGGGDGFSGFSNISNTPYPKNEDFEIIDANTPAAPSLELNHLPVLGFSAPYETIVPKQDISYPLYPTLYPSSVSPYSPSNPYPVSNAHPANTEYPVTPTTVSLNAQSQNPATTVPVSADGSNSRGCLGTAEDMGACCGVFVIIGAVGLLIWALT